MGRQTLRRVSPFQLQVHRRENYKVDGGSGDWIWRIMMNSERRLLEKPLNGSITGCPAVIIVTLADD